MSFFTSQESLYIYQWILRAIVGYLFLIFAAKLMGQRSISQLRFLDFVTALVLGNILAHPLSDEKLGMQGAMITTMVLIILYVIGTFLSLKCELCRKFLEPLPVTVIKNGQIITSGLTKARISINSLLSELRKNKVADIKKVAVAFWEPGGTVSVFLEPQYEPVTPSDMYLSTQSFSIPKIVIKEGKIDLKNLKEAGKDELWLRTKINETVKTEIKEVLHATLDVNDHLHIILR